MQKRVALARAIAAQPDIMFFDEPTTGLDPIMGAVIDGLMVDCVKHLGSTAVAITHDMASARRIGDAAAMIHRGRIVWSGPAPRLMDSGNPVVDQFTHGRSGRADPDGAAAMSPARPGTARAVQRSRARRGQAMRAHASSRASSCRAASLSPAMRRACATGRSAPACLPSRNRDAQAFLHAVPGVVFDASNKAGKFVVVSPRCGFVLGLDRYRGCTGLDRRAGDRPVPGRHRSSGLLNEREDPQEKALRYREYRRHQEWAWLANPCRRGKGSATRPGDADRPFRLRRFGQAHLPLRLPDLRRGQPKMGRALREPAASGTASSRRPSPAPARPESRRPAARVWNSSAWPAARSRRRAVPPASPNWTAFWAEVWCPPPQCWSAAIRGSASPP